MQKQTVKTIARADLVPCENYEATYCPESDKLHLYIGRVPREEYDFLRAEGWTSTPKQSEAGQGEFAAVWTPGREATALQYAGFINDEDTPPTERAADRAKEPTVDSLRPRFEELNTLLRGNWMPDSKTPEYKLIQDARYCGLVFVSSMSQVGWSDKGAAIYKAHQQSEQLQAVGLTP